MDGPATPEGRAIERAGRERRRPAPWTAEQWRGAIIARQNGFKEPEYWSPIVFGLDGLFETAEDVQKLLELDHTPDTFESPFTDFPDGCEGDENNIIVKYCRLTLKQFFQLRELAEVDRFIGYIMHDGKRGFIHKATALKQKEDP